MCELLTESRLCYAGDVTLKLVDDNAFVDSVEGEGTFAMAEPDEVGRTQPYAHEPVGDQTLPPERRAELSKDREPVIGLDGEPTAIVYSVTVHAVALVEEASYTSSSRPASGASSRPSSGSSWGNVSLNAGLQSTNTAVSRSD